MKFQKTLLAASLAVAAVSANAAWVNPAQNLTSFAQYDAKAPVIGVDRLSTISIGGTEIDLGSQAVGGLPTGSQHTLYEVFNYKTQSGKDVVSLQVLGTDQIIGFYELGANSLIPYTADDVLLSTLTEGGQLATDGGATVLTGNELKVINSEHLLYGYQGVSQTNNVDIFGQLITPTGETSDFEGVLQPGKTTSDVKYVHTGIVGNTGPKDDAGHAIDPSKNIYGVSAKDGNNITVLTGNGIALGNLANGGQLHADGSVVTENGVLVGAPTSSARIKSREYATTEGWVVEVFNDNPGAEVASKFYTWNGAGNELVEKNAAEAQALITGLTPSFSGTADVISGNYKTASTKNTVTNQNVTYSEQTVIAAKTQTQVGLTDPEWGYATVTNESAGTVVSQQSQSVSTGIIAKNGEENVYGLEVKKSTTDANGTTDAKTTITADGIKTSGIIEASDFLVGGKSIVQNIETSVSEATKEVVTKVENQLADNKTFVTEAVTEVNSKVAAVETGLTAAAKDREAIRSEVVAGDTATLASANAYTNTQVANVNSRMNQLNSRVDDVEKTAYRGIAIALAAQQQIPNIGAGQYAVFGGVGHYEGESAAALGVASVFADGRTSVSAALGFGGSEVGGRVGVSYVFGGK